jgi:hypothetical protein
MKNSAHSAYTLLDVLASLLVLSMALAGAIALIGYGLKLTSRLQSESLGWVTAHTIASDPDPPGTLDWTATPTLAKGYLNGFYCTRETISTDVVAGKLKAQTVKVTVYETMGGGTVAAVLSRALVRAP